MDSKNFTGLLNLSQVAITDEFWASYLDKVIRQVIPYQWEALNDRIADADKSYCIHNFAVAAGRKEGKHEGCVFQDSDLAKWIEAVGHALSLKPDAELEKITDETIELICAAQQPDGYLNTYYIINGLDKRFTNLQDHHELYCFGHMLEAAIAYYQATGKDALLRAMERYAVCISQNIGPEPEKLHGYPGHEVAEMALAKLYEITGDEKHLKLAQYFIDQRGQQPLYFKEEGERNNNPFYWRYSSLGYQYYQAGKPVRQQADAEGHAVRAAYLCSGIADVARITKDEELYNTALNLWNSMVKKRMYITGAIGSSHHGEAFTYDYDLPNDTIYGETCAAIGLVFFARRMLQLCPKAEYADVMERALYNGVISGMSLDGKRFFYVNPLEVVPEATIKDDGKRHVKAERQKWFGCACCPPNIARLLASIGHYIYTENADTLFINLYVASSIDIRMAGQDLSLAMDSRFPWQGDVKIAVTKGSAKGKIALRIPGWCGSYTMTVNGQAESAVLHDGYAYIAREWKAGDEIAVSFAMPVTLMAANPLVREDIGKVAVTRGPLVYCMEEKDNGTNLHLLRLAGDAAFTEEFCPEHLDGVMVLKAQGERLSDCWPADGLYYPAKARAAVPQTLTFIPYYAWANRGVGEMSVWIRER